MSTRVESTEKVDKESKLKRLMLDQKKSVILNLGITPAKNYSFNLG